MEIYDALKIAVSALRAKGVMPEKYRLAVSTSDTEGWDFWFQRLPLTPGADVTVHVTDQGETHFLWGK